MKIIIGIIYLLCLAFSANAQVIGANGEGFPVVVTQEDIDQIKTLGLVHPIAIRWPGGGDSKVAFPAVDKPGIGMNRDSIIALYKEFPGKKNKTEEALNKDLRSCDIDQKEPQSALMALIAVAHQVKNFQVDYCLNVMQGTPESNIHAIQTLIDSGVHVTSIVAGNETFYSYQFDFEHYQRDFEPILRACQNQFPKIPRLLCIAQDITAAHHQEWNTALINYIKSHNDLVAGVDIHYYPYRELRAAIDMHPKKINMINGKYYPDLDAAFSKYIALYQSDDQFPKLIAYLNDQLPGKIYQCTEFGDKEAELWSNTVASGAHAFMNFCQYRNDFNILLMQNMMGNWLWSARRAPSKFDDNPDGVTRINRTGWYAMQLANELPYEAIALENKNTIPGDGVYYYYFNNAGGNSFIPEFNIKSGTIDGQELHFIAGAFSYSSAGSTGFMDKASEKSMEVRGIQIQQQENNISVPAHSFGYIKVIVQ